MKTSKSTFTISHLEAHLAAYAAAGIAIAAPAFASTAEATVVYSGPVSLTVPANVDGLYLNLVTGATGTASFAGYDFNPYLSTNLKFFESSTYSDAIVGTGTAASALTLGTTISAASTFLTSVVNGTPGFTGTGLEYAGIRFVDETTGLTDYGWVQLSTTTGTGFPATVVGYAYDNTGAAIAAGQIVSAAAPEPTTNAALGLGALAFGAVAVRRLRKNKLAVA